MLWTETEYIYAYVNTRAICGAFSILFLLPSVHPHAKGIFLHVHASNVWWVYAFRINILSVNTVIIYVRLFYLIYFIGLFDVWWVCAKST